MWSWHKIAYGGRSATRLHAMTLKFKTCPTDPKHIMVEHLMIMSTMICDLEALCNNLNDDHATLAIIGLLSKSWSLKLAIMHNEN